MKDTVLQWSEEEEEKLQKLWPVTGQLELTEAFPDRTWRAIQGKAQRLIGYRNRSYHLIKRAAKNVGVSWTREERAIIKRYWGHIDKRVIQKSYLPKRSVASIEGQARRMGLTTDRVAKISNIDIVQQLIRERKILGWSRAFTAKRSGYSECQIAEWERGNNLGALPKVIDWAETLGFELVLIPKEEI